MNAPDLSIYHAVHAGLRTAAHRLAATAGGLDVTESRQLKAFRSYWKGYEGEVLVHHTVEDDFFFVALADKVPVARDYMARIGAEHHDLDELMSESDLAIGRVAVGVDGATGSAQMVLNELAVHMDAHLDFEDAEILPLFERHFTAEEYSELDERAMKSLGIGRQAVFSVPFIVSAVSAEERVRMIAEAPLPLRALYRMTRGHYDRMTAAAFGRRVLEEVR